MDIIWDGATHLGASGDSFVKTRSSLADAAKSCDWKSVFDLLAEHGECINSCRPGGKSWYTPLHQAAYSGAPLSVVQRLIKLGAFRTIENARGERPVDVAERNGHQHLLKVLEPALYHRVPAGVIRKIQSYFHEVIKGRIDAELPNHNLRLPELSPLLELQRPQMWFPVPGMYGGFSYELETPGVNAKLIVESWSRICGGSGQRHEITTRGAELVEEGFV